MNQSKRVTWGVGATLALLAFLLMGATGAKARQADVTASATLGPGIWPEIELVPIHDDLDFPVYGLTPPGNGERFFLLERYGRILLHEGSLSAESDENNGENSEENSGWQPTPVLDLSGRISAAGECGLLGMAFPPDFGPDNRVFYVYYSSNEDLVEPPLPEEGNDGCDSVIARFTLSEDLRTADPDSEEQILVINQPETIHNGAHIEFGPDGALYIATGDGISFGQPPHAGQRKDTLLGKMLRIRVGDTPTYTIPADNPFIDEADARPEIWAYGLRNPYRFSFDRETGDMYIADVGQNEWEEVNFQPAGSTGGENYGWPQIEGPECYGDPDCDPDDFTAPVYAYPHEGDGCTGSVTGGHVYRGPRTALQGIYLFGDYCTRKLRGLQQITATAGSRQNGAVQAEGWEGELLLETDIRITGFAEDDAGHVYLMGREGQGDNQYGVLYRIETEEVDEPEPAQETVFIPIMELAD